MPSKHPRAATNIPRRSGHPHRASQAPRLRALDPGSAPGQPPQSAPAHRLHRSSGRRQKKLVIPHPLGGCRIAPTCDEGALDQYGRVFDGAATDAAGPLHRQRLRDSGSARGQPDVQDHCTGTEDDERRIAVIAADRVGMRVTAWPRPVPSSRESASAAGWHCTKLGSFRKLLPRGDVPFSWINPLPLWRSRNDKLARWFGDPTNDLRREWVRRLGGPGQDDRADAGDARTSLPAGTPARSLRCDRRRAGRVRRDRHGHHRWHRP